MTYVFVLIFISSIVTSAIWLLYAIAKAILKNYLSLQIRTMALKSIAVLQPILIIFTLILLPIVNCNWIHDQDKQTIVTGTQHQTEAHFPNLASPLESEQREERNRTPRSSFENFVYTTLSPNFAFVWFSVFILLLGIRAFHYTKFRILLKKAGLQPVPYSDTKLSVFKCDAIASPFLLGLFNPCIVIPSFRLDTFEYSLIIKHEMIHHKHQDILFKMLLDLLRWANWFNPMFYFMQKNFTDTAEMVVDQLVTENLSHSQRKTYGLLLLKFSENRPHRYITSPKFYSYLSENGKQLKNRLEAIMTKQKIRKHNRYSACMALTIATLIVVLGVYLTSTSYANAVGFFINEEQTNANNEVSSKLILDDGFVQIYDGPENIDHIKEFIDQNDRVNKNSSIDTGSDNTIKLSDLEEIKRIVLKDTHVVYNRPYGSSVYSLTSGTVISAKFEAGYGNCVTLRDNNGHTWKHGYCSTLVVNNGDIVNEGDLIAYVGHSGFAERDALLIKLFNE